MNPDIRLVKNPADLIGYFSGKLGWNIDLDDFEDIEDITYDFEAEDIADAAGWEGNPEEFLNAMIDCGRGSKCGFIEKTEKGMFIHDWDEYGGILENLRIMPYGTNKTFFFCAFGDRETSVQSVLLISWKKNRGFRKFA